jgi:hypothetical protein
MLRAHSRPGSLGAVDALTSGTTRALAATPGVAAREESVVAHQHRPWARHTWWDPGPLACLFPAQEWR